MKTDTEFTVGSCVAGIGGFDWGFEQAGMKVLWQIEKDPFCQKVLAKHWPHTLRFGDIYETDPKQLPKVNLICGGIPCQPFSVAGKRKGKADDRYLWPEMFRIIQGVQPSWVVVENVYGFINLGLETTLSDLEAIGYETLPPLVIPACAVGAPHQRKRVWIIAHSTGFRRSKIKDELRNNGQFQKKEQRWVQQSSRTYPNRENVPNPNSQRLPISRNPGTIKAGERNFIKGATTNGDSWWSVEPNVGRVVARLSSRMDGVGLNDDSTNPGTQEILQTLRGTNNTKTLQWTFRGFGGIQAQKILLSQVCKLTGPPKPLGNISLESKETPRIIMRGVWFHGDIACTSCRRAATEQRQKQHPNSVRLLSQLLACDCGATWLDPTGTASILGRADRLRALGNAIVPRIAGIIGLAILKYERLCLLS